MENSLILAMSLVLAISFNHRIRQTYSNLPLLVGATLALWGVIGVIGLSILIGLVIELAVTTVTYLTLAGLFGAVALCFMCKVRHRPELSRLCWTTELILLSLIIGMAILVLRVGACDALSCDTMHHFAHLQQFLLSDELTFGSFSITAAIPGDTNYYAYVGATYLPLIYLSSSWLHLHYETIFLYVMPVLSCATLVTGAYFLGMFLSNLLGIKRYWGVAAAIASLGVFSTSIPHAFSGHPEFWSIGYPSSLANSAGLFLLAHFLFVFTQPERDSFSYYFLFILCLAIVPLHSGFSIIIGIYIGLFCLIYSAYNVAVNGQKIRSLLERSAPVLAVFLLGWAVSVVPKLIGLQYYGEMAAVNLEQYMTIPLLVEHAYGRTISLALISNTRWWLLSGVLILYIANLARRKNSEAEHLFLSLISCLYLTVLACYAILFIPYITEILVSIVSFGVLVRLHWFTDLILLNIVTVLAFYTITNAAPALRSWSEPLVLVAVAFLCFMGIQSHYFKMIETTSNWQKTGFLTRSDVLKTPGYRKYMESLPPGSSYLVHNRGKFDGSTKHIELGLVKGKINQPIYAFTDRELAIANLCSIHEAFTYAELTQLIESCQPDYVFYWEWPGEAVDPFVFHGLSVPQKTFSIKRDDFDAVSINVHNFKSWQGTNPP